MVTVSNIEKGAMVQFRTNCFSVEEDIFGSRDDVFEVLNVHGAVITLRPLHGTQVAQISISALQGIDRVITADPAEEEPAEDVVNQPSHYQMDAKCAYDVIVHSLTPEELRGYLKGNMLKYLIRANKKGSPQTDVEKALWYAEKL